MDRDIFLRDQNATETFARDVAHQARPGDLILLEGDLGTGKSTFARAFIRARTGIADLDVPSPTFLLVLPYDTPTGPILHTDLYRLSAPEELDELGLEDDPEAIVLVEWPDRDPALTAKAALNLTFTHATTERNEDGMIVDRGRSVRLSSPLGRGWTNLRDVY